MSAVVLVPYFWTESPARDHALRLVVLHLGRLTGVSLEVGGEGEACKPALLNALVRQHPDADVLVMNDADTIVPHAQIRAAISLAEEAPGLVYAYRSYWRLSRAATEALDDPADVSAECDFDEHFLDPASTGCVAISRTAFEQAGGLDERFGHWGYDDMAFGERCRALWPHRRVDGDAFHLWHGERREDDSPLDAYPGQVAANWKLYQEVYGAGAG